MYDGGFMRFFEHLNKTKRLDSTVVIFFGDHVCEKEDSGKQHKEN